MNHAGEELGEFPVVDRTILCDHSSRRVLMLSRLKRGDLAAGGFLEL
jgi:hypothetical protein